MNASETVSFGRAKWLWNDAITFARDLTPMEKNIALAIGSYFNAKTRETWVSRKTIAKRLGMSERTVERAVSMLEQGGYIECLVPRGSRRGGRGKTNVYRMPWPLTAPITNAPYLVCAPEETSAGVTPFASSETLASETTNLEVQDAKPRQCHPPNNCLEQNKINRTILGKGTTEAGRPQFGVRPQALQTKLASDPREDLTDAALARLLTWEVLFALPTERLQHLRDLH